MTVDEYINDVLRNVRDKDALYTIDRELRDHIYDLTEKYVASGYTQEDATQKALERMGDSETAGTQFGKLYNKKSLAKLCIRTIISNIILIPFYVFFSTYYDSSLYMLTIIAELSTLLFSMISIYRANKIKSITVGLLSLPFTLFHIIYRTILNSSPLIFCVYFLITGKFRSLFGILASPTAGNYTPFSALSVVSIIFYIFWIFIYVVTIRNIKNYDREFSEKSEKILTKFSGGAIIISVISILICIAFMFNIFVWGLTYDGIYIVESDTKCNFSELSYTEENLIEIDYDFGQNFIWEENTADRKISNADMIIEEYDYFRLGTFNQRTHAI